jgi:CubicO group peptidase (beta-lactamase class C family)
MYRRALRVRESVMSWHMPYSGKGKDSPCDVEASKPGAAFQYSNAGYDLLGVAAETVTKAPFSDCLRAEVLDPLGVEALVGTIEDGAHVAALSGKHADTLNWSTLPDSEMPSGGLVMTARGILDLLAGFARPKGSYLPEQLRSAALSDGTGRVDHPEYPTDPAAPWGLGPEPRGNKARTWAGSHAGTNSFGHYGGSGCLAWHDPSSGISWAICNTRTVGAGDRLERDDWVINFWSDLSDKIVPFAKSRLS